MDAWIEIYVQENGPKLMNVASFMDAWIEITQCPLLIPT